MATKVMTNHEKGSIAPVPYKRKVRLLLWGGAYKMSDNHTFDRTVRTVTRDYKSTDKSKYVIVSRQIESADDFIAVINSQEPDSIRSLDLFTHGGPDHFYMVSVRDNRNGSLNTQRWYRYAFHNESFSRSDLKKLKFDRFAENAKVELQGCQTALDPKDEDNIAADFSKHLFAAGKTRSVVIGHTTNTEPEINGKRKTAEEDQDYRHGNRAIFRNGKLLYTTSKKGGLSEAELEK